MFNVPYHRSPGFKISDALIPGNSRSDNPVVFDLAPAWGPDLARIRSVIHATIGVTQTADWSPEVQEAVIAAFEKGGGAFINTVEEIRGLTVPQRMAFRAGLIPEKPTDMDAPFAITSGLQFSRIAGALPTMALLVAYQIAELSGKAEAFDERFFGQPSGSGATGTRARGRGRAKGAPNTPKRPGTAASGSTPAGG